MKWKRVLLVRRSNRSLLIEETNDSRRLGHIDHLRLSSHALPQEEDRSSSLLLEKNRAKEDPSLHSHRIMFRRTSLLERTPTNRSVVCHGFPTTTTTTTHFFSLQSKQMTMTTRESRNTDESSATTTFAMLHFDSRSSSSDVAIGSDRGGGKSEGTRGRVGDNS